MNHCPWPRAPLPPNAHTAASYFTLCAPQLLPQLRTRPIHGVLYTGHALDIADQDGNQLAAVQVIDLHAWPFTCPPDALIEWVIEAHDGQRALRIGSRTIRGRLPL